VLKQLHSTLTKAKARRYSIGAIATTQDILKQCQEIFKEIENTIQPLQKSTGNLKEPPVDMIARVKWTFKRSKVQVLQKTLESSKNTLQLMLLVLDLAQKTASPRQVDAIIQGLIVAHRCAVDQLEALESEAEEQDAEQVAPILGAQSSETQAMKIKTWNRERVTGDVGVQQRRMTKKRASVWVSDLIFDNTPLPSGFRRNTWGDTVSSPNIASQARHLVQVWTDRIPDIAENSSHNQEKSSELSMKGSEEGSRNKSGPPPKPLVQPQNLEKLQDVLYVRAMYDYEAHDRTFLSFYKGDIIQVLNQLENDWWDGVIDGVIDGVQGWFPSNYGRVIGISDKNLETSDEESDYEESDGVETGGRAKELYSQDSFWTPQVTADGELYYFNFMTGESVKEILIAHTTLHKNPKLHLIL
jgi:hypothetical protein